MTVSRWERGEWSPSAYQLALLKSCRQAAQREPGVGEAIGTIIVDSGIGRALYRLLGAAFKRGEL